MDEIFEKLLAYIISQRITDVHIEIKEETIQFESRNYNGITSIPENLWTAELIEYLKYQANIDLSKPFYPQSGSFHYFYNGFEYYFRVASIKTTYTESVVLRILNKFVFIEQISLLKAQNELLEKAINQQNGLILISGPTGSGKTTTLYNLLAKIKGRKIYTIEDPIEIYFDSLVQIQVSKQRNLGYEEGLKQILRHDPDVIVVGEIRDETEARMAVRCSLTGHLVIATIHSRSAHTVIARMLDLKVNAFDLNDCLTLISNQRLAVVKKSKKRVAVYEMMGAEEIAYYTEHKRTYPKFLSLDKQKRILAEFIETDKW